jgi:hypothetical protein
MESESQKTTPTTESATKVHIELEYDMLGSQLLMKSKAPTVVLAAALRAAEGIQPIAVQPKDPTSAKRTVVIDFDMDTEVGIVSSDASPFIVLGILVMAHSMMTQNQTLQRLHGLMQASPRHRA